MTSSVGPVALGAGQRLLDQTQISAKSPMVGLSCAEGDLHACDSSRFDGPASTPACGVAISGAAPDGRVVGLSTVPVSSSQCPLTRLPRPDRRRSGGHHGGSQPGPHRGAEAAGRDLRAADRVYVNRNLRLDQIQMVGFDMDYTLALYHQAKIEELSIQATLDKLVGNKGYPDAIRAPELRPAPGHPRAGGRPAARQRVQARPLRHARAGRCTARRRWPGAELARPLPARAHAPGRPALRLDRHACSRCPRRCCT